jgi:GDP/UDP-N,N'-diacetylbacillosamine 2-epimerase (hydrolysing)
MKKNVCVFTGSRAEYGLLKPLLRAINREKKFCLQLLVSGTHLSPEFGMTVREIENDGFGVDERVEILLSSDTAVGVGKSMGVGLIGFSDAVMRLDPDIVVVLGDRYETFAFATAAYVQRRIILHLHGGEVTAGALDEAFRHAITKMSFLHFAATEEYRRRIIQLGEDPGRVFNVGALGVDNAHTSALLSKETLERELGFRFKRRNLLVTMHPATLEAAPAAERFGALLHVLGRQNETQLIFTKANADEEGRIINGMIDEFVLKNGDRAIAFGSLGQTRYLSLMSNVDAVVGNSSSGIIEAPSFKIGTIDIGDRQKGRVKAASVISCGQRREEIAEAFRTLYSEEFLKILGSVENPYGDGRTSDRIVGILKSFDFGKKGMLKKGFYDLSWK